MGVSLTTAQKQIKVEEYDLKAKFLYAFINYINWDSITDKNKIKVGILGESPITGPLLNINKSKNIEIREYKFLSDVEHCNIVFVPYDCTYGLKTILSKFANKPVLIVTENNGYAKKGAHINFIIIQNKLKFEVNLKALKETNLKVSSVLLQHSILIR